MGTEHRPLTDKVVNSRRLTTVGSVVQAIDLGFAPFFREIRMLGEITAIGSAIVYLIVWLGVVCVLGWWEMRGLDEHGEHRK